MKVHAKDIQYTIRGVPPRVDKALREKAAQRKQSLNQVILDELAAATGGIQYEDFSDLVGTWAPDPEFDKILEEQRQIDPEKWR